MKKNAGSNPSSLSLSLSFPSFTVACKEDTPKYGIIIAIALLETINLTCLFLMKTENS